MPSSTDQPDLPHPEAAEYGSGMSDLNSEVYTIRKLPQTTG